MGGPSQVHDVYAEMLIRVGPPVHIWPAQRAEAPLLCSGHALRCKGHQL